MAYGDQEVKVTGSIVLYMYMSEKTDRVMWQVTDTTGVPILGRTQVKLMIYISYQKIHPLHGQSPVSQDSLKSTDYVHSLKTANCSLQSTKTAQSTDSLKTTSKLTRLPRKSTEQQPRPNQAQHMNLSLHKSHGTRVQ